MDKWSAQLHEVNKIFEDLAAAAPEHDSQVYDCPLCRDSGYIIREGRAYTCPCRTDDIIAIRRHQAGLTARLARMRFDNFELNRYPVDLAIKGKSYRDLAELALRDAKDFAKQPSPTGLLLVGEVGCGKTHLAAAVANQLVEQGDDVLFLVVPEFLDQLRASYRRESEGLDESEIISRTYQAKVLILDDMGAHNFSDWVRNKLFTILNHRYNKNLPCLITTNLSMDDLNDNIGERTASRIIEMCRLRRLEIDDDMRTGQNRAGRRV